MFAITVLNLKGGEVSIFDDEEKLEHSQQHCGSFYCSSFSEFSVIANHDWLFWSWVNIISHRHYAWPLMMKVEGSPALHLLHSGSLVCWGLWHHLDKSVYPLWEKYNVSSSSGTSLVAPWQLKLIITKPWRHWTIKAPTLATRPIILTWIINAILLQVLFLRHFIDFVKNTLVTFDQNNWVIEWQGARGGEEGTTVSLERGGGGFVKLAREVCISPPRVSSRHLTSFSHCTLHTTPAHWAN